MEISEKKWSTAYINSLPDSAFLYIHPDYKSGKSKDKSLRYFPVYDADGNLDPAHVRNALARLPQAKLPEKVKVRIRKKLIELAKKLGIKVSEEKEAKESVVTDVFEAQLSEFGTGETEESKTVKATIIKEGVSYNKFYYTRDFLEGSAWAFEGVKCYKDHKDGGRYGRSIDDWVGTIREAHYDENARALKGTIKIVDPAFWEKIKEAREDMGLSVYMKAPVSAVRKDGEKVFMVTGTPQVRSVDFVTEPSAGGRIEDIKESQKEGYGMPDFREMVKDMSVNEILEAIEEVKPDLVEDIFMKVLEGKEEKELLKVEKIAKIVEAKRKEERTKVIGDKEKFKDSVQKELTEVRESYDLLKKENEELKEKLKEEKEARQKLELREVLEGKLKEAKLPDAAKAKIREQFKDRIFEVEELDREIAEAKKIVAEIYESVGYVDTQTGEVKPEEVIRNGLSRLKEELL